MVHLSPRTESLARELAAARQTVVDNAVREALEASLQSQIKPARSRRTPEERRMAIDEYLARIDALPILDSRPVQEIGEEINDK